MECSFCKKECKNSNSLKNHERLCNLNPKKQKIISNFIKYNEKRKKLGIPGTNQFLKAKKLGQPIPIVRKETRLKISSKSKNRKMSDDEKKNEIYFYEKSGRKTPK